MRLVRIVVVDDYEPFRRLILSMLQQRTDFQVVGEASDGFEAIQKAEQLQPDLILLDLGLPRLNGIEVVKRLARFNPHAKVLFLSQESSSDVVRETLRLGAMGYVHKPRIHSDLLPAIEAVLGHRRFVSPGIEEREPTENTNAQVSLRHEVQFYSDDAVLLERLTHFIAAALEGGNPAIVVATGAHRKSLRQGLKAQGVDVDPAIQRGTYISLEAYDMLSTFMVNGWPDPIRFFEGFGNLIEPASKAAMAEHPRVAIFGEGVALLCGEGKRDAAIRLERLGNDLAKTYEVDILCAYPSSLRIQEDENAFRSICAAHSVVYSQ